MFDILQLQTAKTDISDGEKVQHLLYLIKTLFPYLKQIYEEQAQEIEVEANIQGTYIFLLWQFVFAFVVVTLY